MKMYLLLTALCLPALWAKSTRDTTIPYTGRYLETRRFDSPEAGQAVAVDDTFFYAISNTRIARYDKQTGVRSAIWQADDRHPLTHLNSGIVHDGKLYCAHSNYPAFPEASSIEVWDTDLNHIESHSLGVYEGSLTWIERASDGWWAVFAHYSKRVNDNPHAKSNRWTTLVKFDPQWRRTAGWVFPADVLERMSPHSCSGGSWGADGRLYCTGHDRGEIYQLELPQAGSVLKLTGILQAPITGQGIAWDRQTGNLYGIDRARRQVVVSRQSK